MNKLKFKFGSGVFEFEVEGDDDFVKEKTEWATTFVSQAKDTLSTSSQRQVYISDSAQSPVVNSYSSPIQFLLEKRFSNETDITLALAYYIETYENKEYWNTEDLKSEYSVAKRKQPTNISVNIAQNAKKGYIVNPNRDDKRLYCLTPEGKSFIENFLGKETDNGGNKNKTKKQVSTKAIDPEEQIKIDEVKANITMYNQTNLAILEKTKGQKDQTLLSAFVIKETLGDEYEFTPKVLASLVKKLGVSLDPIQVIKMISSNSKCFDNERRGWYKFNEIGCRYVRENILATGE